MLLSRHREQSKGAELKHNHSENLRSNMLYVICLSHVLLVNTDSEPKPDQRTWMMNPDLLRVTASHIITVRGRDAEFSSREGGES